MKVAMNCKWKAFKCSGEIYQQRCYQHNARNIEDYILMDNSFQCRQEMH